MNYQEPQLQQALCNDYVMGLMGTTAQKRFRRLLIQFPQLAHRLDATQAKWNLLALSVEDTQPSHRVWNQLEKRLFRQRYNEQLTPAELRNRRNRRFAYTWAMAASLFSVSLLTYIWQTPGVTQPQMLALVQDSQQQDGWLLQFTDSGLLNVKILRDHPLQNNQDYELWMIASDLKTPQSMGILPQNGKTSLRLSEQIRAHLGKAHTFAVTVEPKGGSPTGQPTSKPIYLGSAVRI
ncbi:MULTISPECIES: anti-sigma factor [Thiomicrorhabdus]|uniref:Anti-sigma factor n=1 Tax=Thiomicrorhabdus heinhorstiae TaxID=2748010 RepID=A0ABS0BYV1_9GAMM|nr:MULTISPECIES: anti-sigma factor [Thiomicrorhabdus]MBF6058980.1 anti-sigma factor [Thiomicrorhabdus heinhorstiae]